MHLGDDDVLTSLDDFNDTLAAARAAIETMAAGHLSFTAQLRIQRASTQRARAYLQQHAPELVAVQPARPAAPVLVESSPARPDETDEILRQTLGSGNPLDVGPEGEVELADDPLASLDLTMDDDALAESDSLVQFTDDDADDDLESVEHLESVDEDDSNRYVVFEEPSADAEIEEVIIGIGDESAFDDESLMFEELDDLEEEGGAIDPVSASDVDQLVSFDDGDDLVTLGGDGDDFEISVQTGSRSPDEEDTAGIKTDATLVTDLESLVRLQETLDEQEAPGAAHTGERTPMRPEPRVADPVRVTTTLTDDDLDRLGFSSTDQLVSPEGADADPHSETGSRPAIRIPSPQEPAREDGAVASISVGGATYTPPRGAAVQLGASLPTIRDQQPGQGRPTAAAIRIDPRGGGGAIQPQEEEALALGGAPDDEDDGGYTADGGFSLDVEEYELVEEEVEEVPEVQAEPEPPPPMPTITADQETRLLRQATAAYDRGELPVAADLFSDVLDFNPDNGLAALGRGRVYLDLGDYARAMSDFTVAEDLRDDDPDVHAAIGELYYARKDYQRAIDYFDEALNRNDRHAMAWCRRGIAHYYRKDYDKAYKDLVKAQKLDDSIPNIRTYIGMVKKKRR